MKYPSLWSRMAWGLGLWPLFFSLALRAQTGAADKASDKIAWVGWSDQVFEQAKKENRFVILDLEAVWCHWCHVMEETTYRDPKVIALMRARYLPVRVDQDSRPDLSNKYEDYGWPATIVFAPNGQELVKRSGYIDPAQMASLLQAILDDPTPGPSVVAETKLNVSEAGVIPAELREGLKKAFVDEEYDSKHGGWGFGHKYLQAESAEWAMRLAASTASDAKREERRVKETLAKVPLILDPAWGGVYQYSAGGDWNEPHFEKIMSVQADNLRVFSDAYAAWKVEKYLKTARAILRYLDDFLLSPEGSFYTSQDADLVPGVHSDDYFRLSDQARRAKGMPRIDQHRYARENGWAAESLSALSMASGDPKPLEEAIHAVDWVLKNRALPGGGFRHSEDDGGRLYLGDTLAMGQAFLRLYGATGDRKWLGRASEAAKFIRENFTFTADNGKPGGYVTVKTAKGMLSFRPQRDENVATARFGNLLYQYTGEAVPKELATVAMRYLAIAEVAMRPPVAGVLLADWELGRDPLHLTIVGSKQDSSAKALFQAAAAYPGSYKRLEWWDRREGPLPRADVQYPSLGKSAAFVCTSQRCSLPIFKAAEVRRQIDRVLAPARG